MAHAQSLEIRNPGPFAVPGGLQGTFIALSAIGVLSFVFGLMTDTRMTWVSFLHNHFFFMSLSLGGLFFASIHWATNAMWSAPVRRVSEAFTAYLPIALLTFIVLIFGLHHLYAWTNPEHVAESLVLQHKTGYLNIPFFVIRDVVAILVWIIFAWKIVANSVAQDANKSIEYTRRNVVLSPPFLVIFAITFTMVSFDQMMSLDPHWFSTIFGVYCFAGLFYSVLALICLVTLYLKGQGRLDGIVNDNHLHDLGKLMFAFTIFWAYIGFAQFMLIWYANLPEEISYYIHRFVGGWMAVSIFLLVGKFMLPFFLLLPRDMKRNTGRLAFVAVFMLVSQWIDVMWMVQPEFFHQGPVLSLAYIGVTLGFIGIFGLVVTRFLAKYNIVAIGDPRLVEAVFHHHQ